MFEKHREANSLAAISRAVAEQRAKQADEEKAAKPVEPPQPDAAAAAPKASLAKEKKEKKRKHTKDLDKHEDEKVQEAKETKRRVYKRRKGVSEEAPTTEAAPALPAGPALPLVDDAFRDWFMARLAEDFEAEIEGLNEADAPVGTRALLQALEGSLALFSPAERRVALGSAGIQARTDPAVA